MAVVRDGTAFRFAHAGERRLRVLVMTSDDPHHAYVASELARWLEVCGVVVEPGADQQRALWRRGKRLDWLARLYNVYRQRFTGRSRYRRAYFEPLTDRVLVDALPRVVVRSVNDDDTIARVRAFAPDVTVVCGTRYIRRTVLEHTGLTINVHGGYLPDYRGNHCVFFAFLRGDFDKIAATLHVTTPDLDGGEIVEVVPVDVYPHDDDEHLYCRAVHAAVLRLHDVLLELESGGRLACRRQPHDGSMYRHRSRTPWVELSLWIRRRTGRHPVPHVPAGRADRAPAPWSLPRDAVSASANGTRAPQRRDA